MVNSSGSEQNPVWLYIGHLFLWLCPRLSPPKLPGAQQLSVGVKGLPFSPLICKALWYVQIFEKVEYLLLLFIYRLVIDRLWVIFCFCQVWMKCALRWWWWWWWCFWLGGTGGHSHSRWSNNNAFAHMRLSQLQNNERSSDHNAHRGSVTSFSVQDTITPLYFYVANSCLLFCGTGRHQSLTECSWTWFWHYKTRSTWQGSHK